MEKNIENILKQALIRFQKDKGSQVKGECLTENEMASLLDGKIPAAKRDAIFEHLLSCPKCANEVKDNLEDLEEFETKGAVETPKELIQSALDLVKPKETLQPESIGQHEEELVTSMPFADKDLYSYAPPSLMIKNFKVICPPLRRRGRTPAPPRIIKKIYFTCNYDCYVYLFEIKAKKVGIIAQKQKFLKGVKNELIGRMKKPFVLSNKGKPILVFTRKPFKNISNVKKALLLLPGATPVKLANLLKQGDEKIVVKFL